MRRVWILLLCLASLLVAAQAAHSPVLSYVEGTDEPHPTPWWVGSGSQAPVELQADACPLFGNLDCDCVVDVTDT